MSKVTNVRAELIDSADKHVSARRVPGAFWYTSTGDRPDTGIVHSCPCGCGEFGYLNLDPRRTSSPCWTNDGTHKKPTLLPSVGIKKHAEHQDVEADGYHWHGHLMNGVWKSV